MRELASPRRLGEASSLKDSTIATRGGVDIIVDNFFWSDGSAFVEGQKWKYVNFMTLVIPLDVHMRHYLSLLWKDLYLGV